MATPRLLSLSFHSGRTVSLSDILRPPQDGAFYFLQSAKLTNNSAAPATLQIGFEFVTQMMEVEELVFAPGETREVQLSRLARALATGAAGWTVLEIQAYPIRGSHLEPYQFTASFTLAKSNLDRRLLEAQARLTRERPELENEFLDRLLQT